MDLQNLGVIENWPEYGEKIDRKSFRYLSASKEARE
jgi:hypothetical protein